MKALLLALSILSTSAFALECGENIVDREVHLSEDLDCSEYEGFSALTLRGSSKLFGHGKKIIAPNTSSVIYAEGERIEIHKVEVVGNEYARGVQAYNVEKLIANRVKANNMSVGVDYYVEENFSCDRAIIYKSDISSNDYGTRIFSPNCAKRPLILASNLSDSRVFAADIEANNIKISGWQWNNYSNSANGLNLKATNQLIVRNINMKKFNIKGKQLFVHASKDVIIYKAAFGNSDDLAVDLYDVERARVIASSFKDSDIGLRVANDTVATDLTIKYVHSSGNSTVGVLVDSYGPIKFSNIDVSNNNCLDNIYINGQDDEY